MFLALFLVFNSIAGRDAAADLIGLLVLLLTAFASGFLEFFHFSLTIGAQSGQAGLFSIAVGLEASLLLSIGRLAAVEQGAFAIADGFLLGATVQGFVFILVIPAKMQPNNQKAEIFKFINFLPFVSTLVSTMVTIFLVLTILLRGSKVRDGLLDAGFEIGFHSFMESFPAFTASRVVLCTAGATSFLFLFGFSRRSASVTEKETYS